CVLAASIDRFTVVMGRAVTGTRCRVHSTHLRQTAEFDRQDRTPHPGDGHLGLVRGVVAALVDRQADLPAFEAVITGNLPVAGGLSSSASLTAATARFLQCLGPVEIDPIDLAIALQGVENRFAGVRCGLLDPLTVLCGQAMHWVYLDCATQRCELLPTGDQAPAMVLFNAGSPRELVDGRYNERRGECEAAAGQVSRLLDRPIDKLCQLAVPDLEGLAGRLDPTLCRRARHVIEENHRVSQARTDLLAGRWDRLGQLLVESHRSSQLNFENSTPELDAICEAAWAQPGCWGARLCGAGWGGSAIALVHPAELEQVGRAVRQSVLVAVGREPGVMVCKPADGAHGVVL
ncbi:MAG: galactokinase, partial [Phycisphaerae bacterium]